MRIEFNRLNSHACKTALEGPTDVALRWKQDLRHRPIMPRKIDDGSAADAGPNSLMREELHHVD